MARQKQKINDINKRVESYNKKVKEFSEMSLDDLQKYFQNNYKTLGGSYRKALLDVTNLKLKDVKEEIIDKRLEEIKESTNQNEQ